MQQEATNRPGSISLIAAISIGIGGMIGAGIFSILGVVANVTGSALPLAFLIGGAAALLAAYSYVMLGKRYPSAGGAVTFIVHGYGDTTVAGTLNVFQYLAYIITIALYAAGFAAYAVTFVGLPEKVYAVAVVLVFTAINFLGNKIMGRAESIIVIIKVGILVVFIVAAFLAMSSAGVERLNPTSWPDPLMIFAGAGLLFVGYEGFGLITNTAASLKNVRKQLARAVYIAVAIVIVIYVLVAIGVVMNLPLNELTGLGDAALAEAAQPTLGHLGFTLIAIAALLSTASAVNATLFGSANIAFQLGKNGELPPVFKNQIRGRDVQGLFITTGIVLAFVLIFPLRSVAAMGSGAFLLIYTAVGIGHLRIRRETGARAWPVILSVVTCVALFVLLFFHMVRSTPSSAIALGVTLVVSLAVEVVYRRVSGRNFAKVLASAKPPAVNAGCERAAP